MWLPHINGGVTVARAQVHTPDPTFISRERLNRLRWNLLREQRPIWYVASTKQWGRQCTCTLHLSFRFLAWIGWFKVDDCGISIGNFKPTWHVQVTLRRLSYARSFIAHKALYWFYVKLVLSYYERANAASGASSFEFKGKIWVFAARPGPTRPHHAL